MLVKSDRDGPTYDTREGEKVYIKRERDGWTQDRERRRGGGGYLKNMKERGRYVDCVCERERRERREEERGRGVIEKDERRREGGRMCV